MSRASNQPPSEPYRGFEQGPIRPPSEARSLLVRVTRSCDWNHCTFCPVYKEMPFSVRPVEHVLRDIDLVHGFVETLRDLSDGRGAGFEREALRRLRAESAERNAAAFAAAYSWVVAGDMRSVFLQDANALAAGAPEVCTILEHLRTCFPDIERVTTYARSGTLARIDDSQLSALRAAGLNRIHVGLESGLNRVLRNVKKGASQKLHIAAGRAVKRAGIELSEYYMPGLGGREHSREHALESARAMNAIDPDFIRLRTLTVPSGAPIFDELRAGGFEKCRDLEIAEETLVFLEALDGISSRVTSDHILNLFEDLEGRLPDDKERMLGILRSFLALPDELRSRYQLGRRLGLLRGLDDLEAANRMARVDAVWRQLEASPETIDAITDEITTRYV